jgi:hypothetical protein
MGKNSGGSCVKNITSQLCQVKKNIQYIEKIVNDNGCAGQI